MKAAACAKTAVTVVSKLVDQLSITSSTGDLAGELSVDRRPVGLTGGAQMTTELEAELQEQHAVARMHFCASWPPGKSSGAVAVADSPPNSRSRQQGDVWCPDHVFGPYQ